MIFGSLITGILLIFTGLLVKRYPNLIAGYNTLSEAQKERVNLEGLSSLMQRGLVFLGALSILLGGLAYFIDLSPTLTMGGMSCLIGLGLVIMIVKAQKYQS